MGFAGTDRLKTLRLTPTVLVAVAAAVWFLVLEWWLSDATVDGLHFSILTSEDLVHTIPMEALRAEPLRSLWWAHAYPPGLDLIRAPILWILPDAPLPELLRRLDTVLVVLWAAQFGAIAAVVWSWLRDLAGSRVAAIGAALWVCHPAALTYGTLLESTQLTALMLLVLVRQLWRVSRAPATSLRPIAWTQLTLLAFRALVQWPFMLVTAASMLLVGARPRQVARLTGICFLVAGAWLVKQYVQFGWWSTSTAVGSNLARSIGEPEDFDSHFELEPDDIPITPGDPLVLSLVYKVGGEFNHNHRNFVELHRERLSLFIDAWRHASWARLFDEYRANFGIFLGSHRTYLQNFMITALPVWWTAPYELLFTRAPLLVVTALCGLWWYSIRRRRARREWAQTVGVALPVVVVVFLSIVGERGENMRFRYFIEPIWWVFLVSQAADALSAFYQTLSDSRPAEIA